MNKLIWDKTLSWNAWFRDDITLPRLKAAGYAVVGLTVGGGSGDRAETERSLAAVQQMVEKSPHLYRVVRDSSDIDIAQRENQLALELNFQGANALENRIDAVAEFHALGIRQIGLVWNADNDLGCSSTGARDSGLTATGRDFIREMNRVGMLIDGTHASYRTTMAAMDISEHPIIFSHGNVDAIRASYKNLKDDQIRKCAERGGVIGISGFGTYLDDLNASPEAMFRQIDYVCELVGSEHVGLGLDFVSNPAPLWEKVSAHPELWPDLEPSRFFPPEEVTDLIALMERAGYSEHQVAGVLGKNWKRVSTLIWNCGRTADKHHD